MKLILNYVSHNVSVKKLMSINFSKRNLIRACFLFYLVLSLLNDIIYVHVFVYECTNQYIVTLWTTLFSTLNLLTGLHLFNVLECLLEIDPVLL